MTKGPSAETALLSRQAEHILQSTADGTLLIVEPPEAADAIALLALLSDLNDSPKLAVYTTDLTVAQHLPAHIPATASAWLDPTPGQDPNQGDFSAAILYMPKSKARLEMLLHMVAPLLREGGALFVVGHNQSGVGSAIHHVEALIGPPQKIDAAKHCALYEAHRILPLPPPSTLASWFTPWTLTASPPLPDLTLNSLPGVFSHGRLDEGTQRLLKVLDLGKNPGRVLDLGCGAGVIGMHIAQRWPQAHLTCCDVSLLAVATTAHNLSPIPPPTPETPHRILGSDVFSALNGERFNHIITNPPFHRGLSTEHEVTERIIRQAPKHLTYSGTLWVVVNRFRNAPEHLKAAFGRPPERVHEDGHFTVFRSHRH